LATQQKFRFSQSQIASTHHKLALNQAVITSCEVNGWRHSIINRVVDHDLLGAPSHQKGGLRMRLNRILCWSSCVLLVGLNACQQDSAPTSPDSSPVALAKQSATYVISFGTTAPSDLAARIENAGGKLKHISLEAGVASATSEASDFATKVRSLPGVEAVAKDRVLTWVDPNMRVQDAGEANAIAGDAGPSIGTNETFFRIQWALRAVHAAEAWATGARGAGVRVAVLDGGMNNNHIDLAGTVDVTCSASMVDGFSFNQDLPGFSHATHVGGIVAARDNAVGTIGIAPGARIIGVKVLQAGSGSFDDVIKGILYAANPSRFPGKENCLRADVINMSLGATFVPEPGDEALLRALSKATTYAYNQGVTVIASAGNNGLNLDRVTDVVTVPAQSAKVLAVSATGPVGFALGATNFSRPASYSNFGKSLVTLAGPGGDFVLPDDVDGDGTADRCTHPLIPPATITNFCWVFDLVLSPGSLTGNSYFFAAGTSMAAPAAAAVAALIIEKKGRIPPAEVQAVLRESAEDLGKPGFDAHYGHGFVDALRAIQ
jgi:subtilisin family serine protease